MARALPRIVAEPSDIEARAEALEAAWLAGTCLGAVPMGLHHKLCHTLGGSFGLPHAATHTVVLPQVMAYNAGAVPVAMRRIAGALAADGPQGAGSPDAAGRMHELIRSLHGPTSLQELGMAADDLPRAVELAMRQSYTNPRELTVPGLTQLLDNAWHGRRPDPT
jgi:alcohol dehydrogenase class IV